MSAKAQGKETITISNNGTTIMKLLDIVHPTAKILVNITKSQVAVGGSWGRRSFLGGGGC
ncbi:T-complex protein 1 subunit eta [Spatholobus suberectus]|nr:T-complex protein 1 subunit eta [Spatholobus suberectus]